jgi:hypothetical protein
MQPRERTYVKCIEHLLFVPQNAVAAEPPFAIACLLAALFFVATRFAVFELYALRHYNMLQADPGDYVSVAVYIASHGRLPNDGSIESRMFPGLPIVMSAVNPLVGNMVLTGYLVSWLSALGSIFLFHKIFRNFRSTLFYAAFVPYWLMTSTLIMSEGLTSLLMLTAIWAIRERALPQQLFLLALAGFVLVVRNTAVFFLVPFLLAYSWQRRYDWRRLLAYAGACVVLPLAYLAWTGATLHEFFPQQRGQLAFFLTIAGDYPTRLLTWPGQSLLHGLALTDVPLAKKLSVLASLVLLVGVTVRFFSWGTLSNLRDHADSADLEFQPFGWACAAHLFFHLCIGGSFGFSSFDRYVSQLNPLLVRGLAGDRQVRWVWIGVATVVGVLFAGLTGHSEGVRAILPFLKPE